MRTEETWRADVKTVMQIKGKSVKRKDREIEINV